MGCPFSSVYTNGHISWSSTNSSVKWFASKTTQNHIYSMWAPLVIDSNEDQQQIQEIWYRKRMYITMPNLFPSQLGIFQKKNIWSSEISSKCFTVFTLSLLMHFPWNTHPNYMKCKSRKNNNKIKIRAARKVVTWPVHINKTFLSLYCPWFL